MEILFDILLDALIDAVKIFPVIFLVYLIIEIVESRGVGKKRLKNLLSSKGAPFFGSCIGVIPQCGFSVIATKLYRKDYILTGTLISVYIATSDEAIPILFSQAFANPDLWLKLILLISIKLAYAVIVGFIVNAFIHRSVKSADNEVEEGDNGCHHHEGEFDNLHEGRFKLLLHPLLHSLKIFAYILIINVVFGLMIGFIGEDKITSFLDANIYLQPLFSTLIGLIPNCASSVLLTKMYAANALSLGGAVAGLSVNCGLGFAILIKDGKSVKNTLFVILSTALFSLFIGYLITVISLLI